MELLVEVVDLYEEDYCRIHDAATRDSLESFTTFVRDNLPPEVIAFLQEVHDCVDDGDGAESLAFLEDIYEERIVAKYSHHRLDGGGGVDVLDEGCCLMCERKLRLTSHHVFPRSTHHLLLKRGIRSEQELCTTIRVCHQCHKMIHKSLSNDRLASEFYSIELLLSDEKLFKYAKWASKLSDNRAKVVR